VYLSDKNSFSLFRFYVACAQAFHVSRWHFCRSTGVCFDMEIYDIKKYYTEKSTRPFLLALSMLNI